MTPRRVVLIHPGMIKTFFLISRALRRLMFDGHRDALPGSRYVLECRNTQESARKIPSRARKRLSKKHIEPSRKPPLNLLLYMFLLSPFIF
jgi:hypothetical protein